MSVKIYTDMCMVSLWLCLAILCMPGLALDMPIIFEEATNLTDYSPMQLEETSSSSSDLAANPSISPWLKAPNEDGSIISHGLLEKECGYMKEELNRKVEPNSSIREEAERLASKRRNYLGIELINDIFSYLKFGDGIKDGWNYVLDQRGNDYWNYANETFEKGNKMNSVGLGDCDDFAIYIASFVESIGGSTRIVLANNSSGGHAYAEVYLGRLDDEYNNIEKIIRWLEEEYDVNKIYGHINIETKEAWLNLDWGPDVNGNSHPGGPLFQANKHYVLFIRDEYGMNPLNVPKEPNRCPRIINFSANKKSPQGAGSTITWTVNAIDKESDKILYNFCLNGISETKWTNDSSWLWTATEHAQFTDYLYSCYYLGKPRHRKRI